MSPGFFMSVEIVPFFSRIIFLASLWQFIAACGA